MDFHQAPLEDYALLADRHTGALVSREGSIDWLCVPRFDSNAVLAALLGDQDNGRWLMAVRDGQVVERHYDGDTFILLTRWRGPEGEALVTDFMPQGNGRADVIRRVECTSGTVTVHHELSLRFRNGVGLPWIRHMDDEAGQDCIVAISGPDALVLHGPELRPDDHHHVGDFELAAGEQASWALTWFASHKEPLAAPDIDAVLAETREDWTRWALDIVADEHCDAVRRSLLVLRALTDHETGGIVAAPTTSLPESFGGERNWDYRYVWLRDSALTVEVMVAHGLSEGAWREWLLRAVASDHDDLQIMYSIAGERVPEERSLEHLAGYQGSRPVRVGNGAAGQYQADVIGEVMLALQKMRDAGIEEDQYSWSLQRVLLDETLERIDEKDHGIWEMRGDPHYFTHGRVMMWAAFDCGVRAVEQHGMEGNVDSWRQARARLREEVETKAFNTTINSFTQTYCNDEVDASLLVLPHTGFLAADDPRMLGTVARIEQQLVDDEGFVRRYRTSAGFDGLEGEEYPFLLCSFWLVTQYARSGRMAGNFPQAFSHLGLAEAALALQTAREGGRREERA